MKLSKQKMKILKTIAATIFFIVVPGSLMIVPIIVYLSRKKAKNEVNDLGDRC